MCKKNKKYNEKKNKNKNNNYNDELTARQKKKSQCSIKVNRVHEHRNEESGREREGEKDNAHDCNSDLLKWTNQTPSLVFKTVCAIS